MASFTGVGDNVTLQMTHRGDVADIDISGTYDMEIQLQREMGSPGSGAWEMLKKWDTADATVAYKHTTDRDNESLRLIVTIDTSGTATATLADNTDLVLETTKDQVGFTRVKWYQDGPVFYNQSDQVVFDGRFGQRVVNVPDAATYTVLAANSGKTHVMPDLTADCVITLPSPVDGLEYEFVYKGVAADAQDWNFDTGADANFFLGGVSVLDVTAGDEVGIFRPDGNSNSKFNVLTPDAGTLLKFTCDGTNWIISGAIVSATDPTFADQ